MPEFLAPIVSHADLKLIWRWMKCQLTVWHSVAASAGRSLSKTLRSRARSGQLQCRVGPNVVVALVLCSIRTRYTADRELCNNANPSRGAKTTTCSGIQDFGPRDSGIIMQQSPSIAFCQRILFHRYIKRMRFKCYPSELILVYSRKIHFPVCK